VAFDVIETLFSLEAVGRALEEPFESFANALFCDRAVVGGWDRQEEPIKPYTTAETMDAGWCWQIEHESRVIRGYVTPAMEHVALGHERDGWPPVPDRLSPAEPLLVHDGVLDRLRRAD